MKKHLFSGWFWCILLALFVVPFSSCEKDEDEDGGDVISGAARYSFWRGDIDNYYYLLDMNDQWLHRVKGKPFMVIEYNSVTNVPIRCEFGLYQASNEYLTGAEGAIPEPFLSAATLQYASKLGLSGSVSILSSWSNTITTNEALSGGGYEITIDKGSNMWGHEILHFTFTNEGAVGEINNEDVTWGGRVSLPNAFNLLRRFNSNTLQ